MQAWFPSESRGWPKRTAQIGGEGGGLDRNPAGNSSPVLK